MAHSTFQHVSWNPLNDNPKFKEVREITGPTRMGGDHGCPLVEIVPGVFTAHFNDILSPSCFKDMPKMGLVINSATAYKQCNTKTGYYGPGIEVLDIPLFDDPKQGESHKIAGDSKQYYALVNYKINEALANDKQVVVHCMASLSRSVVLLLAYLMESRGMTVLQAVKFYKSKWDAVWPNDKFVRELIEYETELEARGVIKPAKL